jgi:4-amino-4-deoxy-L-arabinose transferase-like glycosyltransferase
LFKNIFGRKVALLGLLMAFTPYMIMLARGHTGMGTDGYLPATFYLLVGTHFWFKAIEKNKNIYLVLTGLFYGISFQTKWLYLFAIPSLIFTCIILSFTAKSLKSKYYIIPTVTVIVITAGWTLFRILNVGLRAEIFHLQSFWREHSHRGLGEGIFILEPIIRAFTDNVYRINLWEDLQLFLIIPAFIYIFVLIRKENDHQKYFYELFVVVFWWML